MNEPVAQLVTTRPEAEIAADLKARLAAKADEIIALMNEARGYGFATTMGIGLTQDFAPRYIVQTLRLEKHF